MKGLMRLVTGAELTLDADVINTTGGAERTVPNPMFAADEAAAVSGDEIAVPSPVKVGGGPLLSGNGISGVTRSPRGVLNRVPSETEVFLGIAQQMYESLKAIVDNLKPSEREKENIRRKMEELKKLRKEVQDRKLDLEQARMHFVNLLDHADVAELGKLADREAGKIMG